MKIYYRSSIYSLMVLMVLVALIGCTSNSQQDDFPPAKLKTLIVFFDGLRADYITPENMPNLYALKEKGVYGTQHHSIFPTVTRVNAASYATGSYPGRHGLMGNAVYFPEVDKTRSFSSGEASNLMHIQEHISEGLLSSVSLGELIQAAGSKLMVFSSGSTGQAYLQNHTISGGAVINPDLILPEAFETELVEAIGTPPVAAKPNEQRHHWITEAFFTYGLAEDGPMVSAVWFSDPDGTAHSKGIGSAPAVESIRIVDRAFGRILNEIESRGLSDQYNIIVSTDHGFVTHTGNKSLSDVLIENGLKESKESDDVQVVGNALYVKDQDQEAIKKIVAFLQGEEWIGALFTPAAEPGYTKGWVDGTLSFESIHWNHQGRAADILVAVDWNDDVNEYGYAGSSFARGVAGHGGSSSHEIHIPFILYGPAFKKGYRSELPSSNVDIVPTLLHAHGLEVPEEMQGRVLEELLAGQESQAAAAKQETIETSVAYNWGTYKLTLGRTVYKNHTYVDYAKAERRMVLKGQAK